MAGCKYHNIDKSPFHSGYTGYADGVWKISKRRPFGPHTWRAVHVADKSREALYGATLRDISDQLAMIKFQAAIKLPGLEAEPPK